MGCTLGNGDGKTAGAIGAGGATEAGGATRAGVACTFGPLLETTALKPWSESAV